MKRLLLVAAIVPAIGSAASGEPDFCGRPAPHPIDLAFEAAVARSGGVTLALADAQSTAYDAWDRELNRVYAELARTLAPDARDALRSAQRAWLAFDRAQAQWDAVRHADEGTSTALNVGAAALERRRARTCDLERDLPDAGDAQAPDGAP